MGCLMFSAVIFLVEPRDNIEDWDDAAWLAMATMTTVGYGDTIPRTPMGRATATILMVVSSLFMAMPIGIVGYAFTAIWGNRTNILLVTDTVHRLAKWGFGAKDMSLLFKLFDLDQSGEIDVQEFRAMVGAMNLGMRDDQVISLFQYIDSSGDGTIDEKEFVRTLFPEDFVELYGKHWRDGDHEHGSASKRMSQS